MSTLAEALQTLRMPDRVHLCAVLRTHAMIDMPIDLHPFFMHVQLPAWMLVSDLLRTLQAEGSDRSLLVHYRLSAAVGRSFGFLSSTASPSRELRSTQRRAEPVLAQPAGL